MVHLGRFTVNAGCSSMSRLGLHRCCRCCSHDDWVLYMYIVGRASEGSRRNLPGPACVFTGLYLQLYDPQASFVTGLLYPGLHIPRAQLGRITRRLYLDACTGATSAKDFGWVRWVPIAFSTQHPVEHTVLVLLVLQA